eukprot:Nk52_evm30s2391 gene=Nk52_evmTU30s2391
MASAGAKEVVEVNLVHKNAVFCEHIRKQERFHKLYTDYSVNPKNTCFLTGKPNNVADMSIEVDGELKYLDAFKKAKAGPTEKYEAPVTESMEYGWYKNGGSLVPRNLDPRVNFSRSSSEITRYMAAALKK